MSEKPIDIGLTSDSRDFVSAVNDGTEALENFQDGLNDAAKEGDQSAEKLEKSFDETIRTVKELGDASESSLRRTKRATDDAGGGMTDLKDEAKSTAREAAASFDGSAESIIDAFQEVVANAFVGFGPAAVAAGLAGAAGIGLAVSAFELLQEEQQKAKQVTADLGDEFISAGKTGSERLQIVVDALTEMATVTDGSVKSLEELKKAAETLGIPFEDLARAYAGGIEDIDAQIGKLEQLRDAEIAAVDVVGEAGDQLRGRISRRYREQIDGLQKVQDVTKDALEMEQTYYEAGVPLLQAKVDAIEGINDAYDQVVNSVSDYVNAETGILDVEAYLTAIEQRRQALVDYQKNLAEAALTDEQKQQLNAMGQEAASIWLEAYTSPTTTDDQKRRMASSLEVAAGEASGVAMGTLDKEFSKGVETKLKIDTSDAIAKAAADIRAWSPDEKTIRLRVDIVDRYGQPIP